ncbi:hypothetical protein A0256_05050 [Mucilaginibacter sp. PAMC 26640]|nr:hypothetical protein A0256_05050 [Mucilaginibacter sp. PAMC 26640]
MIMKPTYKPHFLSGILAVILSITLYACSKDSAPAVASLVGNWSKSSTGNLSTFEFKSDMTYQSTTFTTDATTGKILGYSFKTTGKYKLIGKALTLYAAIAYANANDSYGTEAELTKTSTPVTEEYTIAVNNSQLQLYFTCPPNANCIASPIVYFKQ